MVRAKPIVLQVSVLHVSVLQEGFVRRIFVRWMRVVKRMIEMTESYVDDRSQQIYRASWWMLVTLVSAGLLGVGGNGDRMLWAQEPAGSAAPQADPLSAEQQQVANRFQKLEELLLRSAELESAENPARAALLQQAAQLGKQSQLSELLARAATRLDKKQFSQALEDQKTSRENLKRLLDLLQSENRGERVREQRDQVRRWIEETDRLLRLQKSLSGRTEGGQDVQQAAGDQDKLSNKADEISKQLGGNKESPEAESKENKSGQKSADEKKSGDGKSGEQKPGEDTQKDKSADPKDKKDGESDDSAKGKEGSKSDKSKPSDPPNKDGESKDADSKPSDSKPSDGKAQDGKAQDGKSPSKSDPDSKDRDKKSEAEKKSESSKDPAGEQSSKSKPSEPSEGQEGKPQEGKSQQGKSQPGKSQEGQPQQGESGEQSEQPEQPQPESKDPTERARKRIEQAKKKMEEAEQELRGDKRKEAVEKQREAEAELRSAIEALEEILRQLREEEIERSLASLETRLRRMLEMQNKVFEETKRLQEITGDQATRQVEIRASSLALEEKKILNEGERAFLLLSEEGSSSAFPEAMQQVNTDISNIAERLTKADIGQMTVTIEQEVVSSLEEMVAALVQVQKDKKEKKEKKKQPGQQPTGEPGDQPLVNKLAELRLIRSLQARINNRTNSLSQMLENPADAIGQATEADLLNEVKGLAERQASVRQVARDIVTGADQ